MFNKFILTIFLIGVIFLPKNSFAQTTQKEQIVSFNSNITVNSDSSINVKENIKYYFPSAKHGFYRFIPYRYYDESNNKYFKTPVENISVTDDKNVPYIYSASNSGNYIELKIGDPNNTITGSHTYVISYKVIGVLNYFSDHDELYWNATGNDWKVPINNVKVNILLPSKAEVNKIQQKCYTGSTGSTEQQCQFSYNNGANYSAIKGPLTIVLGWDKGVVAQIARNYEKSYRYETGWYILIIPTFFTLLLFLYFKRGRDPFGRGTIAPEFSPPENLKPAEIGTLIDEKAGNNDISATLVDLAVRGYLKIREVDKKFSFIGLKEADANLSEYETKLFKSIFTISLKEISLESLKSQAFAIEISDIKKMLYKRVTSLGYFHSNPNTVRNRYLIFALILFIIAGAFFWLSYILVGTLVMCAIILAIFSRLMPSKTREGVIAKEKSLGFKEFLYRAERYRLEWQEKEHIFEKYLPYAMVFGVATEWAKNFKDLYKDPPSWYEGNYNNFNTILFVSSLNSFSSHASGSFSPPASSGSSGFGGGGSSGGGFGGGGGGSW